MANRSGRFALQWPLGRPAKKPYFLMAMLGGLGVGASVMFLFDPHRGRRRRARVRDQAAHLWRAAERTLSVRARDLQNRARGLWGTACAHMRALEVADSVLIQRVRARMGHVLAHPGDIEVAASGGCVTLSGPVSQKEVPRLLAAVSAVHGVKALDNRLRLES